MATRVINGKRFVIQQIPKKHTTPLHSARESNPKQSPESSVIQTTETHTVRKKVEPKNRIVVVRTTSTTKDESGEVMESNENEASKSVELPAALTNGRTSVYLIRRPIPPPETPRPTQLFATDDYDEMTNTTTTTTTRNLQKTRSRAVTQEIVNSSDLLGENRSHSATSIQHSSSPHYNYLENSNQLLSSPTQPITSRRRIRRSRSNSKRRWGSAKRRLSPPSPADEDRKITQSKGVQANLSSTELMEADQSTTQLVDIRRSRGRKTINPQITSANSIVLVHPQEQTIAVIENPYEKDGTIIKQHSKYLRRVRHHQNTDNQPAEESVEVSRWHRCLGCLSRHMCLIIIICLILCLIGLAGVGVSTYFLVINSNNNFVPTVIGIAIGSALVIFALCFLYCTLGFIGSHEDYFSYTGSHPRIGGRTFALISPAHPNAHLYLPSEKKYHIPKKSISIKHRQKLSHSNNITIEMPERLLTGKKMSAKTHEHRLNKVVHNIRHVVKDAKKRYPGDDVPTKVIVKVDENAKATI